MGEYENVLHLQSKEYLLDYIDLLKRIIEGSEKKLTQKGDKIKELESVIENWDSVHENCNVKIK